MPKRTPFGIASPEAPSLWWDEAWRMVELAVPTIIVNLGLFMPPAVVASFVGRTLGTVAMDGFSLGNLVVNLFAISILWGVFTANDTLSPQAFGTKNYREVGMLAIRGFVVGILAVLPPSAVLFFSTERMLLALGQPPAPSALAAEYYRVYLLGLPFFVLYAMIWKFLTAQEITKPLVVVFVINCGIVLPLSLIYFVEWFGFIGSAMALNVFMMSQSTMLLVYLAVLRPHHPGTWVGLTKSWRDALAWGPVMAYVQLGLGGILAFFEWWFWEVLTLVIGTLGVVPLSVQTIAVQVFMVIWMVPLGLAISASVRIGVTISQSVKRAKQVALWTFLATLALQCVLIVFLYIFRKVIFALFTTDPAVLKGIDRLWPIFLCYWVVQSFYTFGIYSAAALGIQDLAGKISIIVLWGINAPVIGIFAMWLHGGIEAVWISLLPCYAIINVLLIRRLVLFDWDAFRETVLAREAAAKAQAEKTAAFFRTSLDENTDSKNNISSSNGIRGLATETTRLLP